MITVNKMNQVMTKLYTDVMDELDFERELAIRGDWQWKGVSEDGRLMAEYALEAARNSFIRNFKEACRTAKN